MPALRQEGAKGWMTVMGVPDTRAVITRRQPDDRSELIADDAALFHKSAL
jgi:hypothetical protein